MTRKEHLKKLPLQKRLQAMENIRKDISGTSVPFNYRLSYVHGEYETLMAGFDMKESRQCFNYWYNIHKKYFAS